MVAARLVLMIATPDICGVKLVDERGELLENVVMETTIAVVVARV